MDRIVNLFLCHIVFQGYFDILIFVIYLDKYFCKLFRMSKGRDKPSVIDFLKYRTLPTQVDLKNTVLRWCSSTPINCKCRTLLLHFKCWLQCNFKGVFSYSVTQS